MAETKKTAKTAETSVEPKKAAPKKTTTTAKKATTAKTAEKKTATAKTAAPKAEEVKVEEVKVVEKKETKNVGPMLKIKLVKSINGRLEKQIRTVKALGLHKVGSETVKPDNAQTRGMIFVVKHLVSVESVKEN